jgi:membrane-bound lytic murein transglycosylase B
MISQNDVPSIICQQTLLIGSNEVNTALCLWEQATRREYFREQLIEAMLMLEAGHGPSGNRQLLGSWAGAMGQCQFMPSSFRQYAVDYDGDGHTGQIF